MQRRRRARGFTLIELMIVVSVIGVLSSFALPRFTKAAARAQRAEMYSVLEKLRTHFLHTYRSTGSYGSSTGEENPDSTLHPAGQVAEWDPVRPGWQDYPFPPNGALRLRYRYVANGSTLLLQAVGSFPGFDAPYLYQEVWNGEAVTSTESPEF